MSLDRDGTPALIRAALVNSGRTVGNPSLTRKVRYARHTTRTFFKYYATLQELTFLVTRGAEPSGPA